MLDSVGSNPRNPALAPSSAAKDGLSTDPVTVLALGDGAFRTQPREAPSAPPILGTVHDAVRKHPWSALVTCVIVGAVSTALIWGLMVPLYEATAQVGVAPRIPRVAFQTDENGVVPLYKSYLNTQVSTMLSPSVLERVLDQPEVQRTEWYKDAGETWYRTALPAIQRLRTALIVRPINDTELINVTMSAKAPADARLIVNTVVDQFLELSRDSFNKTDRVRLQTLTEQSKEVQADIDTAIGTKLAASKGLGTSRPEELRSQLTTQLSAWEAELRALERQRALLEWERQQWINSRQSDPSTSEPVDGTLADADDAKYAVDPEWRRLRSMAEGNRLQQQLAAQRYGEAHPKLQETNSSLAYAEELLRRREMELDNPHMPGAPESTAASQPATLGMLEYQIAKARRGEELLKQQIEVQRSEVARANALAQELSTSDERIQRKRELYNLIHSRLQELDIERNAPGRISVAAYALTPPLPTKDRRILMTVMAVLGALASGAGLALARYYLDPSMRRADEVSRAVHIPFLGQLPRVHPNDPNSGDSAARLHEELRMVRTSLLERVPRGAGAAVLITSPTPEDGKTTFATLLAKSLACLEKKVLLIDADLRRPALAERLGVSTVAGLTALLHGKTKREQAVVASGEKGLFVLPAGDSISDRDSELLADGAFAKHLEQFKAAYDFVILDSPPLLCVADARILAGHVDGAIIVLRAEHSRKADAAEALSRLTDTGCHVYGTVLVGAEPRASYRSYDGYGYQRRNGRTPALVGA